MVSKKKTTKKHGDIVKSIYKYMQKELSDNKLLPTTAKARTNVYKKVREDHGEVNNFILNSCYEMVLQESATVLNTAYLIGIVLEKSFEDHESLAEDLIEVETVENLSSKVSLKVSLMSARNALRRNMLDIATIQDKKEIEQEKNRIALQRLQADKEQNIITAAMNIEGTLEEKAIKFKEILGKNLPILEGVLDHNSVITIRPKDKLDG